MSEKIHQYDAMVQAVAQELDTLHKPAGVTVIIEPIYFGVVRKFWLRYLRRVQVRDARRLASERQGSRYEVVISSKSDAGIRLVAPGAFVARDCDGLVVVMDGALPEVGALVERLDLREKVLPRAHPIWPSRKRSPSVVSQATMRRHWRY